MKVESLIKKLDKAHEGSRKLDTDITKMIFPEIAEKRADDLQTSKETFWEMHGIRTRIMDYTTSIDSALTLIPSECKMYALYWASGGMPAKAIISQSGMGVFIGGGYSYSTPALAICVAALKARYRPLATKAKDW